MDLLFKTFSKESHAYDFLDKGTILFRNLPWFRYVENQGVSAGMVRDRQESVAFPSDYHFDNGYSLTEGIPFKNYGHIQFSRPEENRKYLFCLSRYPGEGGDKFQINRNFLCFGDFTIVILDGEEFIRRFEDAVSNIAETRSYMGHPVEYFDSRVLEGRRDLWRKETQYEWQNEYRFMWETVHIQDGELILHLGSLDDIARVFPTRSLVKTH